MKDSTYEQPLPAVREAAAARAHNGLGKAMGPKWHVYPEQSAAGLWTTPSELAKCAIEIQEALHGRERPVLSKELSAGNDHADRRGPLRGGNVRRKAKAKAGTSNTAAATGVSAASSRATSAKATAWPS